MQTRDLGTLDPSSLTAIELRVLSKLISTRKIKYPAVEKDEHGQEVPVNYTVQLDEPEAGEYKFQLSKDLLVFLRRSDAKKIGYLILEPKPIFENDTPGESRFVSLSKRFLALNDDGSVSLSNKKHVLKFLTVNAAAETDNEYRTASEISHLKLKPSNTNTAGNAQWLVMPQYGEYTLDRFYHKNRHSENISIERRLKILINFLRAVDKLHYAENIIHRDIKRENVILDENDNATIIDFASAIKNRGQIDKFNNLGTTGCRPYELNTANCRTPIPHREYTDAFAAGRTAAELLHLDLISGNLYDKDPAVAEQAEIDNLNQPTSEYNRSAFDRAFADLPENDRDLMLDTIKKMTVRDINKRMSLPCAIDIFETVLLKHRIKNIKKQVIAGNDETALVAARKSTSLLEGHHFATLAQNAMRTIATSKKSPTEKFSAYAKLITTSLEKLTDDDAVAEFLSKTIGVKDITTREQAGELLDQVFSQLQTLDKFNLLLSKTTLPGTTLPDSNDDVSNLRSTLPGATSGLKTLDDFVLASQRKRHHPAYYEEKFNRVEQMLNIKHLLTSLIRSTTNRGTLTHLVARVKNNRAFVSKLNDLAARISAFNEDYDHAAGTNTLDLKDAQQKINDLRAEYEAFKNETTQLLHKQTQATGKKLSLFAHSYALHVKENTPELAEKRAKLEAEFTSRPNNATNKTDKNLLKQYDAVLANAKKVLRNDNLSKFKDVFAKIDLAHYSKDKALQDLRDRVKDAIEDYIYSSLSSSDSWLNFRLNMLFNCRAASSQRIKDMHAILNHLSIQTTVDGTTTGIENTLARISKKYPNSELVAKVKNALAPQQPEAQAVVGNRNHN